MVRRAQDRVAFGGPLADQGVVREQIAESRLEIEQARLLCHHASHVIDVAGNKAARHLVAMAKVAVPRAATRIIDRAIQVHGGAGVTDVTPLAAMYAWHRAMRLFDGPDEVHLRSIAKAELAATRSCRLAETSRGPDGPPRRRPDPRDSVPAGTHQPRSAHSRSFDLTDPVPAPATGIRTHREQAPARR